MLPPWPVDPASGGSGSVAESSLRLSLVTPLMGQRDALTTFALWRSSRHVAWPFPDRAAGRSLQRKSGRS